MNEEIEAFIKFYSTPKNKYGWRPLYWGVREHRALLRFEKALITFLEEWKNGKYIDKSKDLSEGMILV